MKKVLVIDDDDGILSVVKMILSSKNFEVLTDITGSNVHHLVKSFSPDVILLDIRLPDKSGIEICKELKRIYSTPIILFSAHAERDTALRDSGADCYIQKPFDVKNFVSLITFYASQQMDEIFQISG